MVEAPADPEPDGEPQAPDGSGVGGSGEGGYVVGIDTGGTFTDAVLVDSAGAVFFDKAFSTPGNPATGAREALANVCRTAGLDPADVLQQCVRFAHGTTVGTNALLQRRGARVALVLSKGFEDTVVISRGPLGKNTGIPLEQALDFIHNERPAPFVDRALTYGVAERVDLDGDVVAPLDEEEVRRILRSLSDHSADSLAVCLLWSFRNPTHERRVRELAHEVRPDLPVSLSSDVSPISGEYERTMTTVINAYVAPVLSRYIEDLSAALANDGLRYPVQLMSSSGGTVLPADVERRAVSLINGGPVGGLVAARELGRALGFTDAITTDMGGTSFDVGIIHGGAIVTEPSAFVAQGVPVQLEVARVETIGAGGGSIAWTDGDRLMVGPDSAGSDPGPACYGNGGREPTVTDALVVLGLLDPGAFFGGRRRLRPDLACEVIGERIGEPLGLSVDDAAAGIYEIVTSRMSDLIRQATVEAGLDPRAFTVVAFGGAAPLHAAAYAEPLGVREVIVPASSSVFSALGCALADIRYDYARSAPLRLQADAGA
ncbi:MAG TPA: hydantoinase/oxoprolinase family protein, partial [Candidatus Limnocylindrales bacterium]|nr:hydantoinase/oxoprolinase family protein [Candidatus Limnocylindrales bacterium]